MSTPDEPEVTVTLTFSRMIAERLAALIVPGAAATDDPVKDVLYELADHAQQAVYRSGAWEREWICQALGYDWLANLESDPGAPEHTRWQRPRRSTDG